MFSVLILFCLLFFVWISMNPFLLKTGVFKIQGNVFIITYATSIKVKGQYFSYFPSLFLFSSKFWQITSFYQLDLFPQQSYNSTSPYFFLFCHSFLNFCLLLNLCFFFLYSSPVLFDRCNIFLTISEDSI